VHLLDFVLKAQVDKLAKSNYTSCHCCSQVYVMHMRALPALAMRIQPQNVTSELHEQLPAWAMQGYETCTALLMKSV